MFSNLKPSSLVIYFISCTLNDQKSLSCFFLNLCPLHISYGCVDWCSCKTLNSRSGTLYDAFSWSWNTFLPVLLHPNLIERHVPSLIVTCNAMFDRHTWKACPFLKWCWGEKMDLGESSGWGDRLGREEGKRLSKCNVRKKSK